MKYLKLSVVFCALLLFAVPASALLITPTTGELGVSRWDGYVTPPDQTAVWAAIAGTILPLDPKEPLYKSEVDDGLEEGPLAGSYETAYFNDPDDPKEATISYTGGPFVGVTDPAWLLVKDGKAYPTWYLFDLLGLGWDGTEALVLTGFWPDQGAISNVSLYGTSTAVPEPATMLLLGFGLVGLAALGRRRFR